MKSTFYTSNDMCLQSNVLRRKVGCNSKNVFYKSVSHLSDIAA